MGGLPTGGCLSSGAPNICSTLAMSMPRTGTVGELPDIAGMGATDAAGEEWGDVTVCTLAAGAVTD